MKIEFLARWLSLRTDEEAKKERRNKRVIGNEDPSDVLSDENMKVEYGLIVIDTNDIVDFNYYDDEHTAVRTRFSNIVIKTEYDKFKAVYTTLTGEEIKDYSNFTFEKKLR